MARYLNVILLPSLTSADQLAGRTVVVIDVLRATTTITHALAAGAREVLPVVSLAEAREEADHCRSEGSEVVLGGEREGLKIADFDLGNSPSEYTRESVGGKRVIFTTTNGTRTIRLCDQAGLVLLGAFVNFSALCESLRGMPQIDLLCAGTGNEITREDVLLAGAVVDEIGRREEGDWVFNDQANIAADAWNAAVGDLAGGDPLERALRRSRGGRNMIELGQDRDIEIAATIDQFDLVPQWDPSTGSITPFQAV